MAQDRTRLTDSILGATYPRPRGNEYDNPQLQKDYTVGHNSFSGTDVKILFSIPTIEEDNPAIRVMNNIQTLSYSIFRESYPARALGFVGEKGRARNTRTIAGSIVFTVFDRHPLLDLMRHYPGDKTQAYLSSTDLEYAVPDQLPPFDIILQFANEYGYAAELILFGVEVQSEGQVQSIQDIFTENVLQFTARHIQIMKPGGYQQIKKEEQHGISPYGPHQHAKLTFESIMNQKHEGQLLDLVEKAHNPFR